MTQAQLDLQTQLEQNTLDLTTRPISIMLLSFSSNLWINQIYIRLNKLDQQNITIHLRDLIIRLRNVQLLQMILMEHHRQHERNTKQ